MRPRTTLAALAAFVTLAASGAASASPKVAVLGIEVIEDGGTDAKTTAAAKALTEALRTEASKPSATLELAPNTNKDLLELKLLSDCSDEGKTCMAEIGKELKAEKLLYGKIERRRNGYQVSLKLLDVATGEMDKTTSDIIPFGQSSSSGMNRWGRSLFNRLSGTPEDGSLRISANVDSGSVYIDGEIKTSLSGGAAKVSGLGEGTHRVTIEAPGHDRYDAEVAITPGQTEELSVSLSSSGGGGSDEGTAGRAWKVTFWSAAIVAGLSGAAWIYEGKRIRDFESQKQDAVDQGFMPPGLEDGDQFDACDYADQTTGDTASRVRSICRKAEAAADRTLYLEGPLTVIGAGVAVLAGSVMWYRAHHVDREREARRDRASSGKVVEIVPTISPTTVGAGVAIEF